MEVSEQNTNSGQEERPPILKTWKNLYLFVFFSLLFYILSFYIITNYLS